MSKYLFFDIDGTLMGPSRKITEKTKEAIRLARENGHKAFLCTGRAPVSILKSIKEIGFDGIISSAGGFVEVEGEYIYENFINQYVLSEVLVMFTNKKIMFSLETKDALYQSPGIKDFYEKKQGEGIENNLELQRLLEERRNEEVRLPISEFDLLNTKVTKLCYLSEDKYAILDCVKYLSEFFNIVVFSKETDDYINGELILKHCTKGDALKKVVEYYGGDIKDSIAFGDSMNDYQMIEDAGYGVVSYAAPDKLKAIADDTFDQPDDDGIYYCMQRLGLF